ncbi:RNA polymerase sigma factor [Spirosoma endbachense]|uniref:Sigma-70 family RNA polymerase sigma factor n=1 Tax=Spirosoma endbachense TaxID=2666025 RepID=A0A6P1VYQ9_9BACT|nr:sigma-70 family RNA polymerase sigma factor [Spirosoma endbachense]QHV96536.1 sigma-70 family RNA polymerase sigma factor [Spirosoma endbachense]
MKYQNLSDESLVDLLQQDDPTAFELIYQRYWRQLYGFVFQQLGSKEDCEEIIHDLMLSLWQNRALSQIQNLKLYLFIGARNLVNKSIKSRINLRKYLEYKYLNDVFETVGPNEFSNITELHQAIENAVKKMPEKTATIFRMSKMDNMPVKYIALKMELTDKAVEYHITKSLKILRQQLQNFNSDN